MINYVLNQSRTKGSMRLVLLVLADRANEHGRCWPSVADTAGRANLSKRQTNRVIAQLIKLGELRVENPGGGLKSSGHGWTNKYIVVAGREDVDNPIGRPQTLSPTSGIPLDQGQSKAVTGGGKPGHERRHQLTRPLTNPVTNDSETLSEPTENRQSKPSVEGSESGRDTGSAVLGNHLDDRRRHRGGSASIGRTVTNPTRHLAGRKPNTSEPQAMITCILADRGCDEQLRAIGARYADIKVVKSLAAEFDCKKDRIKNAGGWWRARLRAAGTPCL